MTGRPIAMVAGYGVRLTVGRGLAMSHGAGLRITTDVGSFTTVIGHGVRAVLTTGITVGGGPRSSRSFISITITAGTHFTITSEIHIRAITISQAV